MHIKTVGFRRPFSISVSLEGHIICLTKAPQKNIFIFLCDGEVIFKNTVHLGISDAACLAINEKNEIIILDNVSRTLNWFDFKLNKISSLKLPGLIYGSMKFEKTSNCIYLPVIDLFVVLQISSNGSYIRNFFDYSTIEGCDHVNSLAIENNRLILLNLAPAALFDVFIFEEKFDCTRYLQYGRNGEGQVRNPTDINILDDYIVVHDYHNYLTQFFDKDLKFSYQVGGKGEGENQFDLPVSGYAANDELYICDQNNDRVVLLNSKSKEFNVIIEDKLMEGCLRRPSGIAIDKNKIIYVADRSNGVIQMFDEDLIFLGMLDIDGVRFNRPSSIAVFDNNEKKYIAIIERKSGSNSLLNTYLLSEDEKKLLVYQQFDSDLPLNDAQDMAASKKGDIYVADTLNRRIVKTDFGGSLVGQVNMAAISGNNRILVKTVFVRDDGDVFTADFDECLVYQFDLNLQIKNIIDFSNLKNEIEVLRAVYAEKDYLLLGVRGANEVLVSDYEGNILKTIDCKNQTGVDWNHPVKFCKVDNGSVLIADKENDRIIKIDISSDLITHKTKDITSD